MGNLYDELLALQGIPHAWEDWTAYRAALTTFLLTHTEPGASACIIGAGACNDFVLDRLCGHFSELRLLDRDLEAIAAGCKRQNVFLPAERIELLGISDETYRATADRMLSVLRERPDRAETQLLREIEAAFASRTPDPRMWEAAVADYVICCGVHSQLLNIFPQMAAVYGRYAPIDAGRIENAVRRHIPEAVCELNDMLFRWAKKGVVIGLERERIGQPGGIDGAWQAMEELLRRGSEIKDRTELLWPFCPGKTYKMDILLL